MRELERPSVTLTTRGFSEPSTTGTFGSVAIVGRGRLGTALSAALRSRGISASEPLGRDTDPGGAEAVLLCVPDAEIARAAAAVPPGPLVGHCSGATSLDPLAPHERFSLHPLMTFTADDGAERFVGAGAAIAGSSPRALTFARLLAKALEMLPFELDDNDRATYHAAASIASNFLITLEALAERLAHPAGADRDVFVPLVRATVENWARVGPEGALTGPVARGDETTIAAQRAAVAERAPDMLALFDVLVAATRELAAGAHRVGLGTVPG